MLEYPDERSIQICNYVDKTIPVTADAEINYALKKYYLGLQYDEKEVERIIRKREEDLKLLMEHMLITSYEELEQPVDEMKSNDSIIEDVKTSDDTALQGHEDDKLIH
jgi:hypothetical protein